MKLTIHLDGGSRGNPGPAGAGVVIADASDKTLFEAAWFLGPMTNNMAEYNGLLRALEAAKRLGADDLHIYSDSELLVRQINGDYRVKDAKLRTLFEQAVTDLKGFDRWKVEHVRREGNQRADELANTAMDAGEDVVVVDASRGARRAAAENPDIEETRGPIVARCTDEPARSVCPAPCRRGDDFVFDKTVPPGVCIHVAAELLDAVADVADGSTDALAGCLRDDCGAAFQVKRSRKKTR